jgi:hypothetical protein
MFMPASPDTRVRVGDRERADAADRLGAHAAAGRLSVEELERRLERAGAAVYASDLRAVEADLPSLAGSPRARPWLPFLALACIVLGAAGSFAVGHPIAPLFLLGAFLLWRRSACA